MYLSCDITKYSYFHPSNQHIEKFPVKVWCVMSSPGAGGVCKYTSSLYSPNPALLQPLTLKTYTLSISSLSITVQVPVTSSILCHPQRAAANPPRRPPLAPPPGTTPRRRNSTEKCQAGVESWGKRQHRKSWSYASVRWVSITGARGAEGEYQVWLGSDVLWHYRLSRKYIWSVRVSKETILWKNFYISHSP